MGWRQLEKRGYYPPWVTFGCVWNSRHEGRYWKRQLSKSRRRAWKQGRLERGETCGLYRGSKSYESTCNYKGW